MQTMTGRISSIVMDKGYCFIRPSEAGDAERVREYFCHAYALKGGLALSSLTIGQHVQFTADPDYPKGPRATEVWAQQTDDDVVDV